MVDISEVINVMDDDEEVTFKPRADRLKDIQRRKQKDKARPRSNVFSAAFGKENVPSVFGERFSLENWKASGRSENIEEPDKPIEKETTAQVEKHPSEVSLEVTAMELATPYVQHPEPVGEREELPVLEPRRDVTSQRLNFSGLLVNDTNTDEDLPQRAERPVSQYTRAAVAIDSIHSKFRSSFGGAQQVEDVLNARTGEEEHSDESEAQASSESHQETMVPPAAEIERILREETKASEERLSSVLKELELTKAEYEEKKREIASVREQFSATVNKMTMDQASASEEELSRLRTENKRLQEELKGSNDAFFSLKDRYGKFKEAVIRYDQQEKELIGQIRTLRKTLSELEQWNKEFKDAAEKKLEEAFKQVCTYRSQAKSKAEEVVKAHAKRDETKEQLAASKRQNAELEASVEQLQSELDEARQQNVIMMNNAPGAGTDNPEDVAELKQRLEQSMEDKNNLKVKMFDTLQLVERLRSEKLKERQQMDELEKENEDLKALCDELLSKLEE